MFEFFGRKVILAELIAVPSAAILTFYKIIKRNFLIHNLTELFVYSGIAVIFLPLLNVLVASLLLVAISIYDAIAVWKTKSMIKLAKFQIEHLKLFAGFFIPYLDDKEKAKLIKIQKQQAKLSVKRKKGKIKQKQIKLRYQAAALGGGDVAFPLMFIGTIFLAYGFLNAVLAILTTTIALAVLLFKAEKGKFYPAMPFLSVGCFLGLLLVLLI